MNFGPTKKSDAPIPCRPCNVKLSPCAATLPKELWEGVFNGLRKGFMTTGHPKIEGLEGACKCGKLEFVVNGELATAMMCHCHMCRKYFSQSTPTPTLWVQPEDAVTITKGKEFYTSWLVPKLSRNLRGQATCYFSKCCGTQIHVQFSDPNGDFTLMWFHEKLLIAKCIVKSVSTK